MLLASALLAGCEESKPCFALGSRCDQSAQFSEFFDPTVVCCEGTCREGVRPPSVNPNVTYNVCQQP